LSIKEIKAVFETQLATISSDISTAYDAIDFTSSDSPYQIVTLVPSKPDETVLGDTYYRETGEFQVYLSYKKGTGISEALDKAETIRQLFKVGTVLITASGYRVNIWSRPKISAWSTSNDRVIVPVIVKYNAEIV